MKKALIVVMALVTVLLTSSSAHAGLVNWTWQATIVDATPSRGDFFGVDGNRVTMSITFDDADVWTPGPNPGDPLFFPSRAASVSIPGVWTELHTSSPAAASFPGSHWGGIVDEMFSLNYPDLIIGGWQTTMWGTFGASLTRDPAAGDHLLPEDLPYYPFWTAFDMQGWSHNDLYYQFANERVTVSAQASAVPEPGTVLLIGSGLLGLVVGRRRASRFCKRL